MAQENSLVSIIINCRNGEQYLQECISSVLEQSYKQIEIIFFDNKGTILCFDQNSQLLWSFNIYSKEEKKIGHGNDASKRDK